MYHPAKKLIARTPLAILGLAITIAMITQASTAKAGSLSTSGGQLNGNLSFVSSEFPSPPMSKAIKTKPNDITIYEWDHKPLGDRAPLLMVHGLRGEYYACFRWQKVIKNFTSNDDFDNRFKVYMVRYDSLAPLNTTVPQFQKAINALYERTGNRPITIVALSMGGNLVYEGMLDKDTDSKVKLVLALGTPFRGSPLFCAQWMQYSIYKNPCFPWTRLDHSLAYKLYFARNPNLLTDLRWDDWDQSIPDVGRFKSRLPLGPEGELTVADTINNRLRKVESESFDKKKIIAYSGYLPNRYMLPSEKRYFENTLMMPYTLFTTKVPAHLGREHPVLKMLNKQITSAVPSKEAEERNGTPFVYQLNDGITPVLSALFVPDRLCEQDGLAREEDLPKLRDNLDVRVARVFRNSDHLTFIDGYHPLRTPAAIKDELNPKQGSKTIFDWMLYDVMNATSDDKRLAGDNAPNIVPATAD